MKLVIGGAYQGKLDYVLRTYAMTASDVYVCSEYCPVIDFDRPILYGLEEFTRGMVSLEEGLEPLDYFKAHRSEWEKSIIISTDISCGVVPLDKTEREWREANGRLMNYLAGEAETVIRLFLGIPEVLKGKI